MDASANNVQLKFIFRTAEIWEAMYQDCVLATKSIDFEQYIVMDDEAGHRFLQLFVEKAKKGVKIRMILDGTGCRKILFNDLLKEITREGGIIHFYNAISWRKILTPFHWLPRNHVKTLLIDEEIAHTGSACLWEIMRDWHDLHIRFTGGAIRDVQGDFARTWETILQEKKHYEVINPPPEKLFRYVVSEPRFSPSPIYQEILEEVKNAKKRIRIVTPYFLPPRRLRRALQAAATRGVKIDILMSARTDVPLADYVSHSYFSVYLNQNINLFLYTQGVLHAKYTLIDDNWATIGSTNIDSLSLLINREANIFIRAPETAKKLWDISDEYLQGSYNVSRKYWDELPLRQKAIGYLGRYIRRVL